MSKIDEFAAVRVSRFSDSGERRTPSHAAQLVMVFVAAIAFRALLAATGVLDIAFDTSDSWEYRDLAMSMLDHGMFGLDGEPSMNRQPTYPAFLAVIFALIGSSEAAVIGAQMVVDALTCVVVTYLAQYLRLGYRAIVTTAFLSVTCIYTVALSMVMMTESLYSFLLVAACALLVRSSTSIVDAGKDQATNLYVIVAGLTLGLCVLARPGIGPSIAIFTAVWFGLALWRYSKDGEGRPAMRGAFVLGLATAAVVSPWMVRNYIVFAEDFTGPNSDQVTLLGNKTDIPTYRHWYTDQFHSYLSSQEEPFVMIRPFEPPLVNRYVYEGEVTEVEGAFRALEQEILTTSDPISTPILENFAAIADKRYAAAPRLYITAPFSRVAKLWSTPRISLLWENTAGHNSGLARLAAFTLYNFLYVAPALLAIVFFVGRRSTMLQVYLLAMALGHTWMYTVFLPMPQGRYLVPLFPLFALATGIMIDVLAKRNSKALSWFRTPTESLR